MRSFRAGNRLSCTYAALFRKATFGTCFASFLNNILGRIDKNEWVSMRYLDG
ncbi:hypothetical protein HMPREF0083_06037 [Aneurinibacillus aneurinilyticus ATCC 12856]|uniref:Uncharacterized protein n=1 Tax=Aneurinibacillus aneurinilyticus ATCC 12856 TaxID=649747 RepID=U1WPG6_ANEAE|nr:hypothetical protein HMPREF0083_06037 [Aneurinibacillus aneurinilyticus ATCC 12856]